MDKISQKHRSYMLFILTLVYIFSFIDRQILVILQESIKADLGLNDTQLGLLSGFSFAVIYVTAGIPIAKLADKANRRNIMALSLTVWSAMTAVSGLVTSFGQLLAARIGVGLGEAGCSPPAHSMISDMYPREKRATALSLYSTGIYIGIGLGFLIGGIMQEIYGWRTTFFIVGIPGILLAIILRFTVREPVRQATENQDHADQSLVQTLRSLWGYKSFRYLSLTGAMGGFVGYGTGNFVPSFLVRLHDVPPADIGIWLALSYTIGGFTGTFLGGALADKFGKTNVKAYLYVPAISFIVYIAPAVYGLHAENTTLVLYLIGVKIFLISIYLAPLIAIAHRIAGPSRRATASALFFFVLNIIGLGLGPVMVGGISDMLAGSFGVDSIRWAMTICVFFILFGVYFAVKSASHLKADLKDSRNEDDDEEQPA